MKSMELSDKSGAVPNVETLSPSQVAELRRLAVQIVQNLDAFNDDDEAGIGELIDFVGPSIYGMRKLLNVRTPFTED